MRERICVVRALRVLSWVYVPGQKTEALGARAARAQAGAPSLRLSVTQELLGKATCHAFPLTF